MHIVALEGGATIPLLAFEKILTQLRGIVLPVRHLNLALRVDDEKDEQQKLAEMAESRPIVKRLFQRIGGLLCAPGDPRLEDIHFPEIDPKEIEEWEREIAAYERGDDTGHTFTEVRPRPKPRLRLVRKGAKGKGKKG